MESKSIAKLVTVTVAMPVAEMAAMLVAIGTCDSAVGSKVTSVVCNTSGRQSLSNNIL